MENVIFEAVKSESDAATASYIVGGMEEKLDLSREIMSQTSTLEAFTNHEKALASGMSWREGELYPEFPFCPSPMVATVDRLETGIWCPCTAGYSNVLFERAFVYEIFPNLFR